MLKLKTHSGLHDYFDSDMSKSTNTVVYFDWKTVIYIYACGKCCRQSMLKLPTHSGFHDLFLNYFFKKYTCITYLSLFLKSVKINAKNLKLHIMTRPNLAVT
jgi:hypothetical protein